ncbi:hypothetical protein pb186bvf_010826 [Paramecium bursaria]
MCAEETIYQSFQEQEQEQEQDRNRNRSQKLNLSNNYVLVANKCNNIFTDWNKNFPIAIINRLQYRFNCQEQTNFIISPVTKYQRQIGFWTQQVCQKLT